MTPRGQLVTASIFAGSAFLLTLAFARSEPPAKPRKQGAPKVKVPARPAPPGKPATPARPAGPRAPRGKRLMYTTYFYTAGEAVVHGFEQGTKVRIVSLAKGATVWKGTVDRGEAKLIKTGSGAFAFLSDKKASFLVGTPSMCTAVGYWVRDREGSFRSDHFLTRLPSSTSASGARVIVWAWKKTKVQIYDRTSRAKLFSGTLAADGYHEIGFQELQKLGSHVLEITAADEAASVQIYYDEGFFVPGSDGRAAGKRFQTFVGDITNGVNDLSLFAYKQSARAVVTDIKTGVPIWGGEIEPGGIHTIALTNRYVRVTSDEEISVAVAPYKHRNITGYAEHHFAAGQEGTGIENTFLLTTPRELWIFSYYDRNAVEVTDGRTGRSVWKGTLSAGQVAGIHPGQGYYRVRSTKGSSAMGGAAACGAEYSPAGGMFEVDEALLKVIMQIKEQRRQRAAAEGRRITNDELNAPLSAPELQQATQSVRRSTKQKRFSPAETRERLKKMQTY